VTAEGARAAVAGLNERILPYDNYRQTSRLHASFSKKQFIHSHTINNKQPFQAPVENHEQIYNIIDVTSEQKREMLHAIDVYFENIAKITKPPPPPPPPIEPPHADLQLIPTPTIKPVFINGKRNYEISTTKEMICYIKVKQKRSLQMERNRLERETGYYIEESDFTLADTSFFVSCDNDTVVAHYLHFFISQLKNIYQSEVMSVPHFLKKAVISSLEFFYCVASLRDNSLESKRDFILVGEPNDVKRAKSYIIRTTNERPVAVLDTNIYMDDDQMHVGALITNRTDIYIGIPYVVYQDLERLKTAPDNVISRVANLAATELSRRSTVTVMAQRQDDFDSEMDSIDSIIFFSLHLGKKLNKKISLISRNRALRERAHVLAHGHLRLFNSVEDFLRGL
jgi:hypothetical protein